MWQNTNNQIYINGCNWYNQCGISYNNEKINILTFIHNLLKIYIFKNKKIKNIAASDWHSVFIDHENILWFCGNNDFGQLGLGHNNTDKSSLPTLNSYFIKNKFQIIDIASGSRHNLCVDDNGLCFQLRIAPAGRDISLVGHSLKTNEAQY